MRFFTSDLHFGSEKSIKSNTRPFKNFKSFINFTIKTWNKQATKNDTIYIIGDFIDCHDKENKKCVDYLSLIKKIKAKVVLIIGNNKKRIIKYFFDNNFESFKNYCLFIGYLDVKENDIIKIFDKEFYLVHKPKDCNLSMLNLFGHSHKAMGLYKSFGFNIGCDLNNYRLYNENDILDMLYMKTEIWDKDENLKLI